MTVSALSSLTMLSPHTGGQRGKIDRITPHCVVGQASAESIGYWFQKPRPIHSCNYGIGYDGKIICCLPEEFHSYCSSSGANDSRAITIECASDTYDPYAMTPAVIASLISLCVDICKRYNKTRLVWIADREAALKYQPADNEMLLTVHRWFDNKSCPGDFLYNRLGDIALTVSNELEAKPVYYETLNDIPEWGLPTIEKLIDHNAIQGDGSGLHLSYELVRVLVILDRMGVFENDENIMD